MLRSVRDTLPRPWWWDAGVGAVSLLIGVVTLWLWPVRLASDVPGADPALRLLPIVVLALVQVGRTRWPGTALAVAIPVVAVDVALGFSPAAALVVADLLYCAVLHGSPRTSRRARVAGPALWVLGLAALALAGSELGGLVTSALSGAAFLVLPVWWAREVRLPVEEAAAQREAAAAAARIAELDRRAAVADERARIARELHDSIAGHLSAIALQSQAALRTTEPAARERVLGSVRENSLRALEEMRALIGVLRTEAAPTVQDTATETPTAPRLAELPRLVESARAGGLDVEAALHGTDALPGPVDLTAYRIVQEALTNVSAHAPGAHVRIDLDRRRRDGGEVLALEVVNTLTGEPAGADRHVGAGAGLEGMRVRAAAVGGDLEAGPADDGWRVAAHLPLGSA